LEIKRGAIVTGDGVRTAVRKCADYLGKGAAAGTAGREGRMIIQMTNCESVLMMECGIPQIKRKDIAITYRLAMEADRDGREKINWGKVNHAIITRWSLSGLQYIKKLAWERRSGMNGADTACFQRFSAKAGGRK
jgi:hypothetical protein